MFRLLQRILLAICRALWSMLPVWLFFLSAFGLLRLTQSVLLGELGIQNDRQSMVVIASFIVANVFRLADKTVLVRLLDDRPLMYSIAWKTLIYSVGTFCFYYLNRLVSLLLNHQTMTNANHQLIEEMGTARFWILRVWLIFLLLIYCSARELIRALGRKKFMKIFFGHD